MRKPCVCRQCGTTFEPPSPLGRPPVFCGPACRTASRTGGQARHRTELDATPASPEEPTST